MRRYGSFVVRWWQLPNGQQRLAIRHVQSDEEVTVAAMPDALAWMGAQVGGEDRAPPLDPLLPAAASSEPSAPSQKGVPQ